MAHYNLHDVIKITVKEGMSYSHTILSKFDTFIVIAAILDDDGVNTHYQCWPIMGEDADTDIFTFGMNAETHDIFDIEVLDSADYNVDDILDHYDAMLELAYDIQDEEEDHHREWISKSQIIISSIWIVGCLVIAYIEHSWSFSSGILAGMAIMTLGWNFIGSDD